MEKNKLLIDATHPEETRVVVLRNGRVEEFDYESAARKPLRGNIYLAKVTRVEPSLQAAFVDYGGNRHGFLAFSEIHPDYYQIPVADRQALLREEAEADAEAEAEADARAEAAETGSAVMEPDPDQGDDTEPPADPAYDGQHDAPDGQDASERRAAALEAAPEPDSIVSADIEPAGAAPEGEPAPDLPFGHDANGDAGPANGDAGHIEEIAGDPAEAPETVTPVDAGSEDAMEEVPERPRRRMRSYKIQEVIKRRQIILVQVVKEERGGKGAALTTYLSLAGRYTVLMPNTGRGGGISRKITNPQDRKRLKSIAHDLEVPEGMGLIIRTAGASRTKQEIKRDFEYEIRLWESVRDMTLSSTAPCLVYEEGNLIKRSIRDLYAKDIDEILVAGEAAHAEALDFMRMLSPSQAKNVIRYEAPEPLFSRYQIERQLNAMFSPYVTLRSGGYLVINQTEALVSIDVNSGKATREFSIEETALHTNLEAAEEIARQIKLRDLAGLIVIDFIDMEERRNNRKVENRLKEALRHDRARIQVGRISHFGLLEMSRQRLRTGVLEGSTSQCPHCQGTGIIRSVESVALAVLRALEDHLLRDAGSGLVATTTANVALYILNNKRAFVTDMEQRYGVAIAVQASERMQGANFAIERTAAPAAPQRAAERTAVNMDWGFEGEGAEDEAEETTAQPAENGEGRRGRRRRRRGRREGRDEQRTPLAQAEHAGNGDPELVNGDAGAQDQPWDGDEPAGDAELPGTGEQPRASFSEEEREERRSRRGRRRGRRGGRRGRDRNGQHAPGEEHAAQGIEPAAHDDDQADDPGLGGGDRSEFAESETREHAPAAAYDDPVADTGSVAAGDAEPAGAPPRRREKARDPAPAEAARETGVSGETAPAREESEPVAYMPPPSHTPEPVHVETAEEEDPSRPTRKGWWQRRFTGT